jgi:hypothetical protein
VKIVVPMPLNLANSRMHWRVKHREKMAYWNTLELLIHAKQIPRPPREAIERARITVTMYLHSTMDTDNAMSRMKWICDFLKEWGYIVDDKTKHLEWTGFPVQVIDRKNQRIEITLEAA